MIDNHVPTDFFPECMSVSLCALGRLKAPLEALLGGLIA
jgi:hypothetical protein